MGSENLVLTGNSRLFKPESAEYPQVLVDGNRLFLAAGPGSGFREIVWSPKNDPDTNSYDSRGFIHVSDPRFSNPIGGFRFNTGGKVEFFPSSRGGYDLQGGFSFKRVEDLPESVAISTLGAEEKDSANRPQYDIYTYKSGQSEQHVVVVRHAPAEALLRIKKKYFSDVRFRGGDSSYYGGEFKITREIFQAATEGEDRVINDKELPGVYTGSWGNPLISQPIRVVISEVGSRARWEEVITFGGNGKLPSRLVCDAHPGYTDNVRLEGPNGEKTALTGVNPILSHVDDLNGLPPTVTLTPNPRSLQESKKQGDSKVTGTGSLSLGVTWPEVVPEGARISALLYKDGQLVGLAAPKDRHPGVAFLDTQKGCAVTILPDQIPGKPDRFELVVTSDKPGTSNLGTVKTTLLGKVDQVAMVQDPAHPANPGNTVTHATGEPGSGTLVLAQVDISPDRKWKYTTVGRSEKPGLEGYVAVRGGEVTWESDGVPVLRKKTVPPSTPPAQGRHGGSIGAMGDPPSERWKLNPRGQTNGSAQTRHCRPG